MFGSKSYNINGLLSLSLAVITVGCSVFTKDTLTATSSNTPGVPTHNITPVNTQIIKITQTGTSMLTSEPSLVQATSPIPEDPMTQSFVSQAIEDLANRLQVPKDEIRLLKFEAVVWPDGSLGCPKPGMNYIQVLIEGYRILLQHGSQEYAYHGQGNHPPFLCELK